jgi:transcription elongation factor Elf1
MTPEMLNEMKGLFARYLNETYPCPTCPASVRLLKTKKWTGLINCGPCGLQAYFNVPASLTSFIRMATRPPFVTDTEREAAFAWARTNLHGYQNCSVDTIVESYRSAMRRPDQAEAPIGGSTISFKDGLVTSEATHMSGLLARHEGRSFPCPLCGTMVQLRKASSGNGFILCSTCGLTVFLNAYASLFATIRLATRPVIPSDEEFVKMRLWAQTNIRGVERLSRDSIVAYYRSAFTRPGRWI